MQFGKFQKKSNLNFFLICNLEHSKKFPISKISKILIEKILKICNLENSKNFRFGNFKKRPILKIPKFPNKKNFYNL